MRNYDYLDFPEDRCVCGCPNGGSHVDYVHEWLKPCPVPKCGIMLCGACKCPDHGVYAPEDDE